MAKLITEWCPNYFWNRKGVGLCRCELCEARREMYPRRANTREAVSDMLGIAGLMAAIWAWRELLIVRQVRLEYQPDWSQFLATPLPGG